MAAGQVPTQLGCGAVAGIRDCELAGNCDGSDALAIALNWWIYGQYSSETNKVPSLPTTIRSGIESICELASLPDESGGVFAYEKLRRYYAGLGRFRGDIDIDGQDVISIQVRVHQPVAGTAVRGPYK